MWNSFGFISIKPLKYYEKQRCSKVSTTQRGSPWKKIYLFATVTFAAARWRSLLWKIWWKKQDYRNNSIFHQRPPAPNKSAIRYTLQPAASWLSTEYNVQVNAPANLPIPITTDMTYWLVWIRRIYATWNTSAAATRPTKCIYWWSIPTALAMWPTRGIPEISKQPGVMLRKAAEDCLLISTGVSEWDNMNPLKFAIQYTGKIYLNCV